MSGAIQLTEVDFEQIKLNLINYLKSTKEFTDYDFEGSNLQVVLNLISYQAQLNAYSTNMVANESFLASSSIRDNVVSNASTVGYLPTSTRAANSLISFQLQLSPSDFPSGYPSALEIAPGAAFTTATGQYNFTFNIIDTQVAAISTAGVASFEDIKVYEGYHLLAEFIVSESDYTQKFILENRNIDTTTIRVEVQENPNEEVNTFYQQANSLVNVTGESKVYWLNEVDEAFYEITFGDGYFGKKLANGAKITVTYLQTTGPAANGIQGISNFTFVSNQIYTSAGEKISLNGTVTAVSSSSGGADIESSSSIKFRAPKYYAAQNRCVIAADYENIIRQIYPAVDDIYVYGGEELAIPEYGRVFIAIKPTTGDTLSNLTKTYISNSLNDYRIASLQIAIVDPTILYVEIDTAVFYNDKATIKDNSGISSEVRKTLDGYFVSSVIDKFGGAARYSRIVGAIDDADPAITRNTTVLTMRRDFIIISNALASYEICFEQLLKTDTNTAVVWSSGFQLEIAGVNDGETYYFEDDTKGNIYLFYFDSNGTKIISNKTFGTVNYLTGEVMIGYATPVTFVSTVAAGSVIQIRAKAAGQDIVAKQSIYLELDMDNSKISSIVDTNLLSS